MADRVAGIGRDFLNVVDGALKRVSEGIDDGLLEILNAVGNVYGVLLGSSNEIDGGISLVFLSAIDGGVSLESLNVIDETNTPKGNGGSLDSVYERAFSQENLGGNIHVGTMAGF